MKYRLLTFTLKLPAGYVGIQLVVTFGLSFICNGFLPEVATARFPAVECIESHQLADIQEVGYPSGLFKLRVEVVKLSGYFHIFPELVTHFPDQLNSLFKAIFIARHAYIIPHDLTQLLMEIVDRL